MVCSVHNHDMDHKLACHPIAGHSSIEEKKIVTKMTINILKTLKIKMFDNVANIKNVYNLQHKHQGYKWSNN